MIKFIRERCRLKDTRFSFGATAAIITNLALVVGLRTGEHAKISIIGGMLIIALADNVSDSVGIHIYQESECLAQKEVWISTFSNFMSRLIVSLTFISLVLFLPLQLAVFISLAWGLLLLSFISYRIARERKLNPYTAMLEHMIIAVFVIFMSDFFGKLIISRFKL
jgi:VIT1/CCC1 family predicted Fe2+/Mn2+ transporter